MFSKRPEICSLVRKLLKICQGWVDPHAVGAYGQYGDELKIKKNVLTNMYPEMCDRLTDIFGIEAEKTANLSCDAIRRELDLNRDIFDLLHKYAKENLLWLNVYVKDSFATRIIRDERMTRTSFVANVGGLLGLCMGFSLVSVAEIFYFCLKRNGCTPSTFPFSFWGTRGRHGAGQRPNNLERVARGPPNTVSQPPLSQPQNSRNVNNHNKHRQRLSRSNEYVLGVNATNFLASNAAMNAATVAAVRPAEYDGSVSSENGRNSSIEMQD